ncbi:hypothetical protein MASR2M17_03090 [Aminivibrio sp.]
MPVEQLEAEGRGFRMDAVGTAGAGNMAEFMSLFPTAFMRRATFPSTTARDRFRVREEAVSMTSLLVRPR